jgi:hypothetical protein
MAVEGVELKIGPVSLSAIRLWQAVIIDFFVHPHLDNLNMSATTPAAVVEPKKKSQGPGAKAKRINQEATSEP